MYITLIFFTHSILFIHTISLSMKHLFQATRSKSYRTCPYSKQINEQIMLSNNINKFVNDQYTYIHIQYMNAFIKDI